MRIGWQALPWFVATAAVYGAGAAPGPIWADSAKLTLYALHAYVPSLSPGDHAGWTVVARLWLALVGGADPVAALHLLSACAGAVTVALTFLATARRLADPFVAHGAAAVVAVAHSHWWAAEVTESYTVALALSVACVAVAQGERRRLAPWLAGAAAGLALACHAMSVVVTAPALLAHVRRRWGVVGLGLVLGTAPLWLAAFGAPADPLTGHHTSHPGSVLWHLGAFVEPARAPQGLLLVTFLLAYNFGPIGTVALVTAGRGRIPDTGAGRPWFPLAALVPLVAMLALYLPARLHLMLGFVVVGVVLAVPPRLSTAWIGAHLACQALLYLLLPTALARAGRGDLGVRELPYRHNATYFLWPIKRFDHGAERYARALLSAAPPSAVVLADFNPGAVLRLAQERFALRPDVTVVPTIVDELLAQPDAGLALARRGAATDRPVVFADRWEPYYRVQELERRFAAEVRPCGPGVLVRIQETALPP